jgi:hypothetical protein
VGVGGELSHCARDGRRLLLLLDIELRSDDGDEEAA